MIYIVLFFMLALIVFFNFFKYKPRKIKRLYEVIFADRGFCLNFPENSEKSYREILKLGEKSGIRLTVRPLKDERLICFSDRYTLRLLGFPGKISSKCSNDVKKYFYKNSNSKIVFLQDLLDMINNSSFLIIVPRGKINRSYKQNIRKIACNYPNIYFEATSLVSYFKIRKITKNVFYSKNPIRKKLQIIYKSEYEGIPNINNLFVAIEENDTASSVVNKLWSVANRYASRVTKEHFLINSPIAHRGILDSSIYENSTDTFKICVQNNVAIEADFVYFKGNIRVYHSDKISKKLGQRNSKAKKIDLKNSVDLDTFLSIVSGKVPVIFDIKDYHFKNRKLEKRLVERLKDYKGEYTVQSFNPFVVRWFYRNYPNLIRGQVGHSLSGLRKKVPNYIINAITNFLFFYTGKPDYIVYDLDKNVHSLSKFNQIVGLPVIGYAPSNIYEVIPYINSFDNFICEDMLRKESWPNGINCKNEMVDFFTTWSK